MQSMTPGERAQTLQTIYQNLIMPIAMSGQPPPDGFDVLLKYLAKYLSLPELSEMVPSSQANFDPQNASKPAGGGYRPGAPNGQYTRTNVSAGMSPAAFQQQQVMQLMGGGGNNNLPKGAA